MNSKATTIKEYIDELPEDRKEVILKLRKTILENLPEWFKEELSYWMIGYVVPHSIYPSGYHCKPELPLPFINIASQKNHIAFYNMWIYSDTDLYDWFVSEYPKYSNKKLDMWKSCVRFKKLDDIPYELLWKVVSKISVDKWISIYEKTIKNK